MTHAHRLAVGTTATVLLVATLLGPLPAAAQVFSPGFFHAVAAGGRLFAFSSSRPFVGTDSNLLSDVFVESLVTGVRARVSVGAGGVQALGGGSGEPSVSATGRIVAFSSAATNLVGASDTNAVADVFVHDRNGGITTRVSVATGGAQGNGASDRPAISGDGNRVVFRSVANTLVASVSGQQIYLRNRTAPVTTSVVSVATGGAVGGGLSDSPAISADGRFVAFRSTSINLGSPCTTAVGHIFVRDLQTSTTTCVSLSSAGAAGTGSSDHPAVSSDGRFVAFHSTSTNLAGPCTNPVGGHVFLRDRQTNITTCVSLSGGGAAGNGASLKPALSADARFIAFESSATNLASPPPSGAHVYVRDRLRSTTVKLTTFGGARPSITGDGRVVVFGDPFCLPGEFCANEVMGPVDVGPNWLLSAPAGTGGIGSVKGFDATSTPTLLAKAPYPGYNGAIRIAYGDVNGDGAAELITAAGPGGGPHVKIFADSTASVELASFFAYDAAFRGGVFVAACDLDGDGRAEIVTGAGAGGGPHVRVWKYTGTPQPTELIGFFAYNPAFAGGVHVACGDVDGTGRGALVTGAGPGGGPHVRVFKLTGNPALPLQELVSGGFFAYSPAFAGGVRVAVGDLEGTGKGQVVTGAGPGGGPHVRSFDVSTGVLMPRVSFFAYVPNFAGGVNVAAGDTGGLSLSGSRQDIITGPGPGGGGHVRTFTVDPVAPLQPPAPGKSFIVPEFGNGGAEVAGPAVGEGGGGGGL